MKHTINLLKSALNIPLCVMLFATVLFCIAVPTHGVNILQGVPPSEFAGDFDSLLVGKWILMMFTPMVVQGQLLENSRKIALFAKMRLQKHWYFRVNALSSCLILSIIWGISLAVLSFFTGDIDTVALVFAVLLPNLILWTVANTNLYYCFGKKSLSGIVLLGMMGISCILSFYFPSIAFLFPSTWGMINHVPQFGASAMFGLNCLLSTLLLIPLFIFREDIYG